MLIQSQVRKLWPWTLFWSRGIDYRLPLRSVEHLCVEWQLAIGVSEFLLTRYMHIMGPRWWKYMTNMRSLDLLLHWGLRRDWAQSLAAPSQFLTIFHCSVKYGGTQGEWATRPWPLSVFQKFRLIFSASQTHIPSHHEKQGGRWLCQNCTFVSSMSAWQIASMTEHVAESIKRNYKKRNIIGHITLLTRLVLLEILLLTSLSA